MMPFMAFFSSSNFDRQSVNHLSLWRSLGLSDEGELEETLGGEF